MKKRMVDLKVGDVIDEGDGSSVFVVTNAPEVSRDGKQVLVRTNWMGNPYVRGNYIADVTDEVNVRD